MSAGVLNVQNANALGSTAAGVDVISGASLEVANGVTIAGESIAIAGMVQPVARCAPEPVAALGAAR